MKRHLAMMLQCRTRRSGFSLIELLVVVSIVTLLVSILLPALKMARETATVASCLSNHRNMGVATKQYLADNDATYPEIYGATRSNSGTAGGYGITRYEGRPGYHAAHLYDLDFDTDALTDAHKHDFPDFQVNFMMGDYITDYRIFLCPSSTQPNERESFAKDYGMNAALIGTCSQFRENGHLQWTSKAMRQSTIVARKTPSEYFVIIDSANEIPGYNSNHNWVSSPWTVRKGHLTDTVATFADGSSRHVPFVPYVQPGEPANLAWYFTHPADLPPSDFSPPGDYFAE